MSLKNKFQQALYKTVSDYPYYGSVILNLPIEFTDKIPTMGITAKGKLKLVVNLNFLEPYSIEDCVKFIIHEAQHITNGHVLRGKDLNHQQFNIAADIAINQNIKDMPDTGANEVMFATLNNAKKHSPDLLPNKPAEYYYNSMPESTTVELTTSDIHDWLESDMIDEEMKEQLRDILKKSEEYAKAVSSSVPPEHHTTINELAPPRLSWKALLRRFVTSVTSIETEETRKKRHRRYGTLHPGNKRLEKVNLGVAVDTSGSISDEELQMFMSEINAIHKQGVEITLIECDAEVRNVSKFSPKKNKTFSGRGGTAYQPAFDKARELGVDAIVFFGDGDSADTPTKPRYPVLWVMVRGNEPPVTWGRVSKLS